MFQYILLISVELDFEIKGSKIRACVFMNGIHVAYFTGYNIIVGFTKERLEYFIPANAWAIKFGDQ